MAMEPGTTLLHYRLIEKLCQGGSGMVWRAFDLKLKREVAVKLLPDEVACDPQRAANFRREAGALAKINHPGIVTIYSVEEAKDLHFFTMELVDGAPLTDQIAAGGLPLDRLLRLAILLAEALDAAHRQGVIHRDLNPANIMVTRGGRVKLLGFGPAKREAEILDISPYLSPEQLKGGPAGHRSDIFSLGAILYEMATGSRPFQRDNPTAALSTITGDEPTPLGEARPDLPAALDQLIRRCLEKLPANRPQSAGEVRLALELIGDRVLEAVPRSAAPAPCPGIAVMPFANLSGSPEQEHLANEVAEEVLNALARIGSLRVADRSSSFAFKGRLRDVREIGRDLGVDTVLEGSVRRSGDCIRISVQIVGAADGYQLWSARYDRSIADVAAVTEEISLAVADQLKAKPASGA